MGRASITIPPPPVRNSSKLCRDWYQIARAAAQSRGATEARPASQRNGRALPDQLARGVGRRETGLPVPVAQAGGLAQVRNTIPASWGHDLAYGEVQGPTTIGCISRHLVCDAVVHAESDLLAQLALRH